MYLLALLPQNVLSLLFPSQGIVQFLTYMLKPGSLHSVLYLVKMRANMKSSMCVALAESKIQFLRHSPLDSLYCTVILRCVPTLCRINCKLSEVLGHWCMVKGGGIVYQNAHKRLHGQFDQDFPPDNSTFYSSTPLRTLFGSAPNPTC